MDQKLNKVVLIAVIECKVYLRRNIYWTMIECPKMIIITIALIIIIFHLIFQNDQNIMINETSE